jgi:hypothetical protein
MDQKLDPLRAKGLRDAKAVHAIPCPLTGSNERHMVVWICPQKVVESTSSNGTRNEISGAADATADDVKILVEASHSRGTATTSAMAGFAHVPEPVAVKKEAKSEEEIVQVEIAVIQADLAGTLREVSDIGIVELDWQTRAESNPLAAVLATMLSAHEKKTTQTKTLLEK